MLYTGHSGRSIPTRSSKHPPPSKPLPSLPPEAYLIVSEPVAIKSLLSHPVPSPSLRFDDMALPMPSEQDSDVSSSESYAFSTMSYRDSVSSIIEFAQSLLPPSPVSERPRTPANTVDCRLQRQFGSRPETPPTSPVSKRSATPEQLHKLCTDLETLAMNRRDSAMFDVTPSKRPTVRRIRTEGDRCGSGPPPTSTSNTRCASSILDSKEFDLHYLVPPPTTTSSHMPQQEVSFIDWDDEIPCLARMKKSIADLRGANRARSHSSPPTPVELPIASSNRSSSSEIQKHRSLVDSSISATCKQLPPIPTTVRPISPLRLTKRKTLHHRRTIFAVGNTISTCRPKFRPKFQRNSSSTTSSTTTTRKRKRASTVASDISNRRTTGLNKLARWMKRTMRC